MFDVCVATLMDDMYVCVMLNKYVEYIAAQTRAIASVADGSKEVAVVP